MRPIPRWAKSVLKPGDQEAIEAAVAEAEKACGAEFVPVIVRQSSGTLHVGVTLSLALLFTLYFLRANYFPQPEASWRPWLWILPEALIAGLLGEWLSRFNRIRRLFTPKADRLAAVSRRARLEYYKHHVESTDTGLGVLLYVSIMERSAVVLCGKKLSKAPQDAWSQAVRLMTQGAAEGSLGRGMSEAIQSAALSVRKHAPAKSKKKRNELSDRVIVKE